MPGLALVWMGVARAQEGGFDAHGFQLSAHDSDLRDPLVLARPGPVVQGDWFFSGLFEYAKAPLVRVVSAEGATAQGQVEPVVDDLVALNLSGGAALHDHVRLDVSAPIYGLTTGPDAAVAGPAMGDLRGTATILVLRPEHVVGGGGAGLALLGHVDAPSGSTGRFLGTGGVAGGGGLALTYEFPSTTLTASAQTQFNPQADLSNVTGSDQVVTGLAVGFLTSDVVGITVEGVAKPSLQAATGEFRTLPPAEALLSLRYAMRTGGFWTFGAAGGLTDGPGVPAFRVFVGGGYADLEPPRPADADPLGALRATDLCPLEPETRNGWKDDDGCPDKLGALQIEVRFRGEARAAALEILGPDGRQTTSVGPQGMSVDAVPGTQWTVTASDACLRGEGNAVVTENGAKIAVELHPVYDAKVLIEVVGPDDAPLPGATALWRSDRPECVPLGIGVTDATGKLAQEVASGTHELAVTAPAFSLVEQPVTLLAGDDKVIRIKLAPSKVVMEKEQIRILEKIQFQFGKAVIRPVSYDLLNQVAAIIVTHPDIGRVEVAGHTDNKGGDDFNQKLSEDRAEAVRQYLVEHGVDAARLLAKGYGETVPIDTNKTETGREANRRVEFNLIDASDPKGGSAPPAPPAAPAPDPGGTP